MNATIEQTPVDRPRQFPPFSLSRLLRTVFDPQPGERVCILIDLEDPREIEGFRFLQNPDLSVQRHAHDVFYQGLRHGVMSELGMTGGEIVQPIGLRTNAKNITNVPLACRFR